jgi:polyisoprenoid-binding protein YceI
MKRVILIFILLLTVHITNAQKYMTKNGYVGFFSHTSMEDIKGDNNQVASVVDAATGDIVFQVLMKSFHFDRALMEEHFNENYVESEKFPKASFTGKISNIAAGSLTKKGTYEVTVDGDMTIHGTTKKVSSKGTIDVVDGGINASSKFNINPEDYGIVIPGLVREKIAKDLEITVKMNYTPVETK